MRVVRFDPASELPIVEIKLWGPTGKRSVHVVFDSGSASTQIDTGRIEAIGYSARDAEALISVQSAAGEPQPGYLLRIRALEIFGKRFESPAVGIYDFDNFSRYGIDGLLGWDIIRQLRFDMDGPAGTLRVY